MSNQNPENLGLVSLLDSLLAKLELTEERVRSLIGEKEKSESKRMMLKQKFRFLQEKLNIVMSEKGQFLVHSNRLESRLKMAKDLLD